MLDNLVKVYIRYGMFKCIELLNCSLIFYTLAKIILIYCDIYILYMVDIDLIHILTVSQIIHLNVGNY